MLDVPVEISDTKQKEHGDYACNFAMMASKRAGMNPRAIGEMLSAALLKGGDDDMADEGDPNTVDAFQPFAAIELAGPGFINLRLKPESVARLLDQVLDSNELVQKEPGLRINVEFVSVNPNGPITVGSGRGAAFGDTLCRVLSAAGNTVNREYYINDGVNSEQMRLFALSVESYVKDLPFPEKGYKGEYVKGIADQVSAMDHAGKDLAWYQSVSQDLMIETQRQDLAKFDTKFDVWFSEQKLHNAGKVETLLEELIAKGVADEEPYRLKVEFNRDGSVKTAVKEDQPNENEGEEFGEAGSSEGSGKTLWLRSTKFGDDMDRVLRRRDGRLTYISSDVAYHADKFNRPPDADKLLTVLGPDHHGYIARLHAVVAAFLEKPIEDPSAEPLDEFDAVIYRSPAERDACKLALRESRERLEVIIFQIVRFLKDGQPAPMRKRDGNIYELSDLISELGQAAAPNGDEAEQTRVGRDVARFFYLARSHDTHMDFDIDLATKQSDENPVFYAQYAYARICSVIAKAKDAGLTPTSIPAKHRLLVNERETALMKKVFDLSWEVQRCAVDYGVHRLTTYAVELGRTFHHFYDVCRVVQVDQPELSEARLALCEATRKTLKATFDLLGVSAPEKMERAAPVSE
ncbi:arginine--tRNA ligase [soil metagenome]